MTDFTSLPDLGSASFAEWGGVPEPGPEPPVYDFPGGSVPCEDVVPVLDESEYFASQANKTNSESAFGYSGNGSEEPSDWQSRPRFSEPDELIRGLNDQQREAVVHDGGPLLIMAGAGSGKTRVLTHRIAYLLATGRATQGQILAITFTNKAAAEMRERVGGLVGRGAEYMWVSTFHSACVRILRREHEAAGLTSSFTIYDAQDAQRLIQMILKSIDVDVKRYSPKMIAAKISDLKNELITPAKYEETCANDPISKIVANTYREYSKRMRESNALDFDDLIMSTVQLLKDKPLIAQQYHRRFRHILVDEYQDTNHAQYVLVRLLVGDGDDGVEPGELTVVGDSDQSIYAFRGATIRNIEQFERDFPGARTILLEQNYRSTQNILSAANAVIARNQGRRPKNLWTASGDGALITLDAADSEHDEARFVVSEVDRLADQGASYGDVAVFYRTNAQSRAIEELLVRQGIPYRVVGGTRFYERKEIKDALAYLQAISNPDDSVAVRRIINVPRRGIGTKAEDAIAVHASRYGISFGHAVRDVWESEGCPLGESEGIEWQYPTVSQSNATSPVDVATSSASLSGEPFPSNARDLGTQTHEPSPVEPETPGTIVENALSAWADVEVRTFEHNQPDAQDANSASSIENPPSRQLHPSGEQREVLGLSSRARKSIAAFWGLIESARQASEKGVSTADILEEILDKTGYLATLRKSEDPQDASRVENLAELHSVAIDFAQVNPRGTLVDFLERVALVADSDQVPSEDQRSGQVTLMTVHTAKGLEFPIVFVTGMEDGTFPHQRSLGDESELAEERRLAYVAITRARERLYLTRASIRSAWGSPQEMLPSQFLADIPPELCDIRRSSTASERLRSHEDSWGSGWGSGSYSSRTGRALDDDGPVFGSGKAETASRVTGIRTGKTIRMGAQQTSHTMHRSLLDLKVGDRVKHASLGEGTVVGLEGQGKTTVARINFGKAEKRLLLRVAPLEKI